MRAARLHQRGGPEAIVVEEAPLPIPGRGEGRLRVRAAALTPGELTWDQTYLHPDGTARLPTIPGHDVAGYVECLGEGVANVTVGQFVYALVNFPLNGSVAEYVVLPAQDVAEAPKSISAEQASAVPLSALTAWQGLFDHGGLAAGQRVLIHGGSGGVGAFAVQLARWAGAHVVTTASARNVSFARDLGAVEVIDYGRTPFETAVGAVDLVFDTVGGETLARSISVLRPGGSVVSIAGMPDEQAMKAANVSGRFFIVQPSATQLRRIAKLIDAGRVRVNIEQIFGLADARAAFQRSVAGHLRGKVVIRFDANAAR
ncbi:MAG: NADP-dependent oxidoreductase [Tepidisphaeraceae bacterium]